MLESMKRKQNLIANKDPQLTWVSWQEGISIRYPPHNLPDPRAETLWPHDQAWWQTEGSSILTVHCFSAKLISVFLCQKSLPFCLPTVGGSHICIQSSALQPWIRYAHVPTTQGFFNGAKMEREGWQTSLPACLHYSCSNIQKCRVKLVTPLRLDFPRCLIAAVPTQMGLGWQWRAQKPDVVRKCILNLVGNRNHTGPQCSSDCSQKQSI